VCAACKGTGAQGGKRAMMPCPRCFDHDVEEEDEDGDDGGGGGAGGGAGEGEGGALGSGRSRAQDGLGNAYVQRRATPCARCGGAGEVRRPGRRECAACRGKKMVSETVDVACDVPPGARDGHVVVLAGEASESLTTKGRGDVLFSVKVQQHAGAWSRDGNDLRATVNVTLSEALVGFVRTVAHLPGSGLPPVVVNRTGEVTPPGYVARVRGAGMPIAGVPRGGGGHEEGGDGGGDGGDGDDGDDVDAGDEILRRLFGEDDEEGDGKSKGKQLANRDGGDDDAAEPEGKGEEWRKFARGDALVHVRVTWPEKIRELQKRELGHTLRDDLGGDGGGGDAGEDDDDADADGGGHRWSDDEL